MNREALISSGEHIAAVRKLGESYSVEEYVEAINLARETGAGERYADSVLGPAEVITGTDEGDDVEGERILAKAMDDLRERGIHDPNQVQLGDALIRVTS